MYLEKRGRSPLCFLLMLIVEYIGGADIFQAAIMGRDVPGAMTITAAHNSH